MNRRRYDDVVRFVASILFGTSIRQLPAVAQALRDIGCTGVLAWLTTTVFFLVYFRNVHGLIAYDIWAENSQYEPSFEQHTDDVIINFLFGVFGAILLPYLFIPIMSTMREQKTVSSLAWGWMAFLLFAPIGIYVFWNWFWYRQLRRHPLESVTPKMPLFHQSRHGDAEDSLRNKIVKFFAKDETWDSVRNECIKFFAKDETWDSLRAKMATAIDRFYRVSTDRAIPATDKQYFAYGELIEFVLLWVACDWIVIGLFLVAFIAWELIGNIVASGNLAVFGKPTVVLCRLYSALAIIMLMVDYFTHATYYFPTPLHPRYRRASDTLKAAGSRVNYYEFGNLWNRVLPDGIEFCHWGGKLMSECVIDKLDVKDSDDVLELCCGYGGALSCLPAAKRIVGLDISHRALANAAKLKSVAEKAVELVCADAGRLPFCNASFTKVFAQDGDAWMRAPKNALMAEIYRILVKGGKFIFQSYACSKLIPPDKLRDIEQCLRDCGYFDTDVPRLEELRDMFRLSGFRVESIHPLHEIYATGNRQMVALFDEKKAAMAVDCAPDDIKALDKLLKMEKALFSEGWWTGVLVVAGKA